MPADTRSIRDLALRLVAPRRITVLAGLSVLICQYLWYRGQFALAPVALAGLAICLSNEVGHRLLRVVDRPRWVATIVNAQVAFDTLALVLVVHLTGGLASLGILLFAPVFFAYGAVLPVRYAFVHVALTATQLALLGMGERNGFIPHVGLGDFYRPDAYRDLSFVTLITVAVTTIEALCVYLSHYLSGLIGEQEEQSRMLAVARWDLLTRNESETARVRALLDVAQHMSATQTVDALLRAVCDTTATLGRVPRVEIFLWDEERQGLYLAAARGLADRPIGVAEVRRAEDVPMIGRLRAGEVVQFHTGPSYASYAPGKRAVLPISRGFAAPMMCRDSFEGALFVGHSEDDAAELMALVQGIARQAALALINVRSMEQQKDDAEDSRVLLSLSQGLSACLDEDTLWSLLVRGASEVLDLPWAVAACYDERSGHFTIGRAHGLPDADFKAIADASFRLKDFPQLHGALARRELLVTDGGTDRPLWLPRDRRAGTWVAVPLIRSGSVVGFLAAGQINDPRAFTRRQRRLAEGFGNHASIALQNARLVADLEATDRLKSEFVSTMSHELRTPLNVIIGYTEMLRDGSVGPVTAEQCQLIDRLDSRGRELLELIEATLHVGRLEAGRDMLEIAPLSLGELLQTLQASTAGLPHADGVAFEWETPEDLGQHVLTDRTKVSLVVRNLVSNAFKFTSQGKVLVRLLLRDTALVIDVSDTGIGISSDNLPIIFDMFRQVDGSMTRRHGGVGLGLYIVKQFVTRLGGTIEVASTLGRGSRFCIVLPGVCSDQRRSAA